MPKITLTQSDCSFFELVADAAFTNPFSVKRTQIDRQIAGLTGQSAPQPIVDAMLDKVRSKLREIEQKVSPDILTIQHLASEHQELIKYVFLFDIFHQFAPDFDTLIRRQEKHPEKTIPIPFASNALEQFRLRGFEPQQAARYLALFYQIRRAFYFIQQGLIGKSDCMRSLRTSLWNNIFTYDIRGYEQFLWDRMEDFATLLEGPTGSGKGAAAAAIGKSCFIPFDLTSGTFQNSFVQLFVGANLSQYAPSLLESELFGHARGAFTGAISEHEGLFGLCRPHGTIFLDEIGEISPQVQVTLLKVLEERTYTPVGSHKTKRFSGRVIAATNRPLAQLREQGIFREDFYYRLCADCIEVPSLAQRVQENPQELVELVEHFTRVITGQDAPSLCEKVINVIQNRLGKDYLWPGNVRELTQCIRRVILKDDYQPITTQKTYHESDIADCLKNSKYSAENIISIYLKTLYKNNPSYQDVARIAGINWRTVKKYIDNNS